MRCNINFFTQTYKIIKVAIIIIHELILILKTKKNLKIFINKFFKISKHKKQLYIWKKKNFFKLFVSVSNHYIIIILSFFYNFYKFLLNNLK